jgi:ATP-dependent DNA ligase
MNQASDSGAWIKLRNSMEQEFVIGGYIPGARGFDALLVGVYEKRELILVAKVKNGFVPRILDEVFPALKALQTAQCPFKNLPEKKASRWGESLTADKLQQCRWVRPRLVCQIAFVEWDGCRAPAALHAPSSLCAMTKSAWRWFVKHP